MWLLIVGAIVLSVGICLTVSRKQIYLGRIMVILVIAAAAFVLTGIGALLIAFSTVDALFYIAALTFFMALAVGAASCGICGVLKKRGIWVSFLSGFVICVVGTAGFYAYQAYVNRIPTIVESEDLLARYDPNSETTKTVTLTEPASLHIESDFPKMDGATALYPVYAAFAKALYPEEIVNRESQYLKCTTTAGAYDSIVTGAADIVFVAAPSREQQDFAREQGVELVYTPIGKEAFVFFVNARNPIKDLTVAQIQQIYTGEITDWSSLGVKGLGKIRAFQRPEGSGSQSALLRLMEGKPLVEPEKEDVLSGMGGIIQKTADYKNYKNAIGYSFRFYATEMAADNRIRLLSVEGVEPNTDHIENGTYPIASDFYAVTRKDATENTRLLLEWIQGAQGQELIARTGYTPLAAVN